MSRTNDIARGSREAEKLGVNAAVRHVFLCGDTDSASCASRREMKESWRHLKRRLKELKLDKRGGVLRTRTFCLDVCKDGPIAVVMPDGCWYGRCTPDVLDEIIEKHLVGGKPVKEYLLATSPLCAGPIAG